MADSGGDSGPPSPDRKRAPAQKQAPAPGGPGEKPGDVSQRLLASWRGEIEARAVYEALAAREKDERRAVVLRRMADAEAGHLRRVEARMRELGVPVPDPSTV